MVKDDPGAGRRDTRRHRHRLRWTVLGLFVAVIAAGAFGYWWKFVRNDEKPVDVAEVERDFATDPHGARHAGTPTPGVYLYRTVGHDSVSALGGQTDTYPRTTTLTISTTPCGVDARWDVMTGRYDIAHRCRSDDGTWTLTGKVTSDRFFNQAQADTYTCDHVVELTTDPAPGTRTEGRCVQGSATTALTYEVVGTEPVDVRGTPVDTIHLRITTVQGGSRSGGGTEERWVQPGTNLVVRSRGSERDRSPSPVGVVTYEQDYDIVLESLTPRS